MTAQQQLAELNEMTALLKSTPHTPHDAGEWARDAVHFIRDHGPAIAELIEAADHLGGAQRDLTAYHENATPGTFNSYKADAFEKARDEWLVKLAAALRKLTQD